MADDNLDRLTDAELYELQTTTVHLDTALAAGRLLWERAQARAARRRVESASIRAGRR